VRESVQKVLTEAARRAVAEIDPGRAEALEPVQLVPARSPEHGDFASNVAMVLAKALGMSPRDLAARIAACIDAPELIERAEVAGPGFLNVFLARDQWRDLIRRVLTEGEAWGRVKAQPAERVMVEFVSANPTGPLTVGHGRNAVLGDCIARLLEAVGHEVTREYYFNDGGRQMRVLGESLRVRYLQCLGREAQLPEGGYEGAYMVDIAQALVAEVGEGWLEADWERFKDRAKDAIFADINATLLRLGIHHDVHFNEHTLYADGLVDAALEDLRKCGLVYEADGAIWLRASDFGMERDRVLVKSSGEPTYLLPDVAYHREKFKRGFERVIDVLGPDHIEQFPYVQQAIRALGHDGERLELALYQWVNLRRAGQIVKMSTRRASFVTIDEVLDEVGADVFRYFMVDRRGDTHLDFDLDLAMERSDRNPVYKIQYAHARLASLERKAEEQGVVLPPPAELPVERLVAPLEIELAKTVGRYPEVLAHAAAAREPQEIARYALDLATRFHSYITDGKQHRVLSDDVDLSRARLALVRCVRLTLASALALLGIGAPEHM